MTSMTTRAMMWIALLTAGALLSGCGRPAQSPAPASGPADKADKADETGKEAIAVPDSIARELPGAELVFVGEVVAISRSPHGWSGMYEMFQEVTYRVTQAVRGPAAVGDQIVVRHLLVEGTATVDSKTVELLPALFHPGASLVVLARQKRGVWKCVSEHDGGVAPATPALVAAIDRDQSAK